MSLFGGVGGFLSFVSPSLSLSSPLPLMKGWESFDSIDFINASAPSPCEVFLSLFCFYRFVSLRRAWQRCVVSVFAGFVRCVLCFVRSCMSCVFRVCRVLYISNRTVRCIRYPQANGHTTSSSSFMDTLEEHDYLARSLMLFRGMFVCS